MIREDPGESKKQIRKVQKFEPCYHSHKHEQRNPMVVPQGKRHSVNQQSLMTFTNRVGRFNRPIRSVDLTDSID